MVPTLVAGARRAPRPRRSWSAAPSIAARRADRRLHRHQPAGQVRRPARRHRRAARLRRAHRAPLTCRSRASPCTLHPAVSIPLTVLWVATIINMVNFIDGLDGLAAGVCAISALTFAVIALSLDRGDDGRGGRDPGRRRLRLPALQLLSGEHLHGRRRLDAAGLRARRDQHPGRAQGRRHRRPDLSAARARRAVRRPLPDRVPAAAQGGALLYAAARTTCITTSCWSPASRSGRRCCCCTAGVSC